MFPVFIIVAAVVLFSIVMVAAWKMLPPHDEKDDLGFLMKSISHLTATSKK